ncbi:MAG: hypothetical protein M9920_16270 [Verrucomicrobiae bacterium]|nr:hypothetical protein [Verrucomicrobiae bacterium]
MAKKQSRMKLLNQYTSRTVPGFVNVLGTATNTTTVSLWSKDSTALFTRRRARGIVGCAKRNLSARTFSEYFITASSFVMEMHADSRSVAAGFGEALVVSETNTTSLFTTM